MSLQEEAEQLKAALQEELLTKEVPVKQATEMTQVSLFKHDVFTQGFAFLCYIQYTYFSDRSIWRKLALKPSKLVLCYFWYCSYINAQLRMQQQIWDLH